MASTWSALKIELLETGANSGTWGTLTNANLGDAVLGEAITGSATVDFASDADVTITLTDVATTQAARNLRLNITESSSGIGSVRNLILGSGCQIEKFYLINNTGTGAKTVKNTSGTGISVPAGKATLVYNDGTNVVDAASYFTSLTLGSALPIASGGTGSTSTTFVNLATNLTGTLPAANGGTGVANNAASTLTISGAFATTLTVSGTTGVTLPTTGTLATLAGSETLTNKTIAYGSNTLTDVVGVTATQTLTNKTLTSPVLTTPQLGTPSQGVLSSCTVDGTNPVGYRNIPQSGSAKTTSYTLATGDIGEFIEIGASGSIVVPDATFAAGDAVVIFNNTSSAATLTMSITTAYIGGTDTDVASISLATRGLCNVLFISSTVCVVTGNVT